jgi:AcrR family transcriptional regulator
LKICYGPFVAAQTDCRERLIDATLSLCTRCGYEATSVDQIAAAADVTSDEFARYFTSKDAVLLSVVEDLLQASVDELGDVEPDTGLEHMLFLATIKVISRVMGDRGVITRDRMLAVSQVITAHSDLRQRVSLVRKRILTQALADWLGVAEDDRRVHQAVTRWSAIVAGMSMLGGSMADHYDPRRDDQLIERMIAEFSATFADVMGEAPQPPPS